MRGILKAYGDTDRKVWVADSFEGLPPIDPARDPGWHEGQMAVSLDEVKENFAGYGLLDDRVRFLKGFFNRTLPGAPIDKLAVFRADADLYESTMDALRNLYPKLSVGGYAIFDDYVGVPGCKRAIDEYRASHGITEPIL
jgi:O-methyltransferase